MKRIPFIIASVLVIFIGSYSLPIFMRNAPTHLIEKYNASEREKSIIHEASSIQNTAVYLSFIGLFIVYGLFWSAMRCDRRKNLTDKKTIYLVATFFIVYAILGLPAFGTSPEFLTDKSESERVKSIIRESYTNNEILLRSSLQGMLIVYVLFSGTMFISRKSRNTDNNEKA